MEVITSLLVVFITAMITNNIVLTTGYGICSYIGVSKNRKSAFGMGVALVFVVFMASLVSYFLEMLLVALNIEFMQTICFILVIASLVQLVEMIVKKFLPSLYKSLGIYLPLITTNCVVLYVTKQICDVETILTGLGLSGSLANNGFFNFLAWGSNATSDEIRGLQSGQIQQYALVFLLGALALVFIALA